MNPHHAPQPRDDDWSNALPRNRSRQGMNMPKVSDMLESKYLKGSDLTGEETLTMTGLKKANLARDDEEPKYRWTLSFLEKPKPMVLNATNIKRIEKVYGDDTDDWIDKPLIVYYDEEVSFGAEVVGGIRVRGPRKAVARPSAHKHDDNDVPF